MHCKSLTLSALQRTRHNLDRGSQPGPPGAPAPQPSGAPSAPADQVKAILEQTSKASTSAPSAPDGPSIAVKAEPLDPLKMDIGDEELETLEREQPEAEAPDTDAISAGPAHVFTALENFTLPPPEPMRAEESDGLIRSCIARMCDVGALSGPGSEGRVIQSDKAQQGGDGSFALWATLVTRLATRGFFERPKNDESESEETGQGAEMVRNKGGRSLRDQADAVRQMMLDFVKADFSSR